MRRISDHDAGMTRNLDIGLLRAFAAVADRRSMTEAGEALNLTQGAVSQQIARLEALAGGPLLVRGRPGLRLTPSGERLLGHARRLVALNDEVWTELDGTALGGPVRLGVPYDLVGTRFAPVLRSFAVACPQVELSLTCAASPELYRDLRAGRLDLAVVEEPVGTETGEILAVDRLAWVGARGGTAHRRTPLLVAMVKDVCAFKPAVLKALDGRPGGWRTLFENGSLEATSAMVRSDLAVSTWLISTVPADLDVLPPDAGLPVLPSFAVTLQRPERPSTPAAGELARHIRDGFQ